MVDTFYIANAVTTDFDQAVDQASQSLSDVVGTMILVSILVSVLEFLFIYPLVLYAVGKIMKVKNEKFTYWRCFLVNLVPTVITIVLMLLPSFLNFVIPYGQYVGLAAYLVIIGASLKMIFKVNFAQLAAMLGGLLVLYVALIYVNTYLGMWLAGLFI